MQRKLFGPHFAAHKADGKYSTNFEKMPSVTGQGEAVSMGEICKVHRNNLDFFTLKKIPKTLPKKYQKPYQKA